MNMKDKGIQLGKEDGGQRSEVRGQRAEDRGQESEVKAEDRALS